MTKFWDYLVLQIREWILFFTHRYRIRTRRYQLEALALRLSSLDHILRTTDAPLMDIWDQFRPGLEHGLGLTEGSLNSDWDPSGTHFTWDEKGWY